MKGFCLCLDWLLQTDYGALSLFTSVLYFLDFFPHFSGIGELTVFWVRKGELQKHTQAKKPHPTKKKKPSPNPQKPQQRTNTVGIPNCTLN